MESIAATKIAPGARAAARTSASRPRSPRRRTSVGRHLIENRWRTYIPTLGQYTSPDPAHRSSVMTPGPQAYAYASGRPLVMTDPMGLVPRGLDMAADAAAAEILRRIRASGNDREYGCVITGEDCDRGSAFRVERWVEGQPGGGIVPLDLTDYGGRDVWAIVHNHPSGNPNPSRRPQMPNDVDAAKAGKLESVYIVTTPDATASSGMLNRWDRDMFTTGAAWIVMP
jgi:RHS repeat-associated protein